MELHGLWLCEERIIENGTRKDRRETVGGKGERERKGRTGVVDKTFERVGRLSVKAGIRRISLRYCNRPHFPSAARA